MSIIHYAASRTHNRNALFQLLQELDANIGLRDENYRTPRDIAVSSNIRENVKTIDKYVVHIIARGNKWSDDMCNGSTEINWYWKSLVPYNCMTIIKFTHDCLG